MQDEDDDGNPSSARSRGTRLLGARIHALRLEKKLSMAALANASGVSEASLAQLERGQGAITVEKLLQLARGLEVPPYVLLAVPEEGALSAEIERLRKSSSFDGDFVALGKALSMLLADTPKR